MNMKKMGATQAEIDRITTLLADDDMVKIAGIDHDGILRGKIMSKEKFLSVAVEGFGMSSVLFGWDMHDQAYPEGSIYTSEKAGFPDLIATPDLNTFRRIPWEDNIPLFLVRFSANGKPIQPCARSLIKNVCDELETAGFGAKAGVEIEFVNFQTPSKEGYSSSISSSRPDLAAFLKDHAPSQLQPLTEGNFCYSLARPTVFKDYFYDIYNTCSAFDCKIESYHTEFGPGVYEAALKYGKIEETADRVTLFKHVAKSMGIKHSITPCFMAKPTFGMPGNSGHIHLSLVDEDGTNMFARSTPDPDAVFPDLTHISDNGRHFLAGLLSALPDLMPMLLPTINSYKRLVPSFWAPVHLSWGLEDRIASIRIIAPPTCKPSATRFEIRIPGADLHPHYALAALLAAGHRGMRQKLQLDMPPLSIWKQGKTGAAEPPVLPNSLDQALAKFGAKDSIARELFGDEFVDFYVLSRQHEIRLFRETVTDWEFKRYIEIV